MHQSKFPTAIEKAKEGKKPVYLLMAADIVNQPIVKRDFYIKETLTNNDSLLAAMQHINQVIEQAQKPILISGVQVLRFNLQSQVQEIAEKFNLPVVTMLMGKSSFDESHENYIGLYAGDIGSQEVQNVVEASDCILAVGTMWSEY